MDGKALAERIRGEVAAEVRELGEVGLATVLVGDDPASDIYIRLKHKAAAEAGFKAKDIRLASQATEEELLAQVEEVNADESIDGLLVQLPLPDHIDEARVIRAIDPMKDVDGLHPLNFGQLVPRAARARAARRRSACMRLLEEYDVPLEGAHAVVVGRSDIVGKPAALLLLQANATVTGLPLADARSRRGHARGRRGRRRRGSHERHRAGRCARGRDRDRRRHEPQRRRRRR